MCNFHYLGYYCSPNLSIHQNSTQEPTWNFLVTLGNSFNPLDKWFDSNIILRTNITEFKICIWMSCLEHEYNDVGRSKLEIQPPSSIALLGSNLKTKSYITFWLQVNNYEIVINFFHISHKLKWYSRIVHKFTRIYPFCSTYELAKQYM